MSNVTYVAPNRTDAGAIPRGTVVETEIQPDGSNRQVVKVPNVATNSLTQAALNWTEVR